MSLYRTAARRAAVDFTVPAADDGAAATGRRGPEAPEPGARPTTVTAALSISVRHPA